jgi:hypothetical protein
MTASPLATYNAALSRFSPDTRTPSSPAALVIEGASALVDHQVTQFFIDLIMPEHNKTTYFALECMADAELCTHPSQCNDRSPGFLA